ncbi:MAG: sugar nucleotide-binding protein [Oscillospiraceae bacterium]|nr:sugar nucleotide-binding protein [Oscillospiraceae bacterium]
MKVLVLGASGLAGSAVMKALQKAGHSVSGTYRTAPKGGGDPALLHFDLDEPRSIVPLLEQDGPDAVVSCLRGNFARQLEAHRLSADLLRRKHGKLVFLSTANVFDGDLSRPHYEKDAPCSDSGYGQFKIACERLLQEHLGEGCVILRPPEIWGADCPRLRALTKSALEGSPVQTYENLSVNYTMDTQIARWVSFILEHDLQGVFHVGTRDTSGYTAFLDRLAQGSGLPRPRYQVEHSGTPAYQAVLPGRPEIPPRLQMSVDDVLLSLTKAPVL